MTLKTNKKKGKEATETCDSKAMLAYLEEYPLLRPFLGTLLEYSAANKFTSTFLGMLLDDDGRARTQYRITGTAFGRLASTKNVWGKGSNFQNLPEKGKVPLYYILQLLAQDVEDTSEEALEFVQALEVLEGDENVEY
jgi:DNA polymerase I-like protein with 3'-5' exonuclease and polymerase domains